MNDVPHTVSLLILVATILLAGKAMYRVSRFKNKPERFVAFLVESAALVLVPICGSVYLSLLAPAFWLGGLVFSAGRDEPELRHLHVDLIATVLAVLMLLYVAGLHH